MKKCINKSLWEHMDVPISCVKNMRLYLLCITFSFLLLSGCTKGTGSHEISSKAQSNDGIKQLFKLLNLKNGDAKFLGERIVTNVDGKLRLLDKDGVTLAQYDDINANWVSVLEDEGIICYGNADKTIGICRIDKANALVENYTVLKSEFLMIDPSLLKADNKYYITATYIDGNVNNGNTDSLNGRYTVRLYVSGDLRNWEHVSDIVDVYSNVEDVRLYNYNGKLQFVYEQEVVDKGYSSIRIKESEDSGVTWGNSRVIVDYNGDNEPGPLYKDGQGGYSLFFSSDKENCGESYENAYVYELGLDGQFIPKDNCRKVELDYTEGRLLLDVRIHNNYIYLLSVGNYITEGNFILEEWDRRN